MGAGGYRMVGNGMRGKIVGRGLESIRWAEIYGGIFLRRGTGEMGRQGMDLDEKTSLIPPGGNFLIKKILFIYYFKPPGGIFLIK
ncbi:hypothetical protein [Microcystis phage Mel-JY01]